MKTFLRFTGSAALAVTFMALGQLSAFAQDPCADADGQAALYGKFTELYPKTDLPSREEALNTAKSFVEKFGACETVKEQIDYFKTAIPAMEKAINDIKVRRERAELFKRYDAAINADNGDELYAAGKAILAFQPENINIMVPMGAMGLYKAYAKDNKYADESIRYAQMALNELKAGKPCNRKDKSGAETCGVLKYEYLRADAIAELTYSIGYQKFYAKNDKKGALPFYYELSQSASRYKEEPRLYATIGSYYVEESAPIGKEIIALIDKQKAATADEEKEKLEGEIKGKVALLNGYTERALDAFSRAHKFAEKKGAAEAALKADMYRTLQALYQRRFEKTDGLDKWIADATAKPLPNPTSEVTPVSDPDPITTTTTTTTGTAAVTPSAVTKPAPPATNGKTATATKPKN